MFKMPKLTSVKGISNAVKFRDFLSSHPSFADQADVLLNFIKNDVLVIHNAEFDLGFINNELKLLGKDSIKNKIVDTVFLARKTLNTRIANLDYLCRRFSIDLSERKLHGALLDCQLLAEVYLELNGGKQISMNLKKTKNTEENTKEKKILSAVNISKITPSNSEILQHKQLAKQIKNSLWGKIDY